MIYLKKISKKLSLLLRHQPELYGLQMDEEGWVSVKKLLEAFEIHGNNVSVEDLNEVVAENDKQRFAFNENRTKIRANQGHSRPVTLGLLPQQPPILLYHGTAVQNLDSIFQHGLLKQNRQYVHCSRDIETAKTVGSRHGKVVVLELDAQGMFEEGYSFFLSENGVWLTDHVPVEWIAFCSL